MDGVGGTADKGVGGWADVVDAGVRLATDECDCFRFAAFGSGVLA